MKLIGAHNYTRTMDLKTWKFWFGIYGLLDRKQNSQSKLSSKTINKALENYKRNSILQIDRIEVKVI